MVLDSVPDPTPHSEAAFSPVDGLVGDVERALAAHYDSLSRGQRRVIDRLLGDSRYGAVASAADLARDVGVSESTVTRAAQALGFEGYPDLQARLRRRFIDAVPQRLDLSTADFSDTPELAGLRVMLEDAQSVRETAADLGPERLRAVTRLLATARRVYVFGSRGSYGLATVLAIGLRLLVNDARVLSQEAGDLPDQLVDLTPQDVVFVLSFRRIDRLSVQVLRTSAATGAATIAITDSQASPMARYARIPLFVHQGPLRLMPSYASAASLVNAILTSLAISNRVTHRHTLERAEQLWKQFTVYLDN